MGRLSHSPFKLCIDNPSSPSFDGVDDSHAISVPLHWPILERVPCPLVHFVPLSNSFFPSLGTSGKIRDHGLRIGNSRAMAIPSAVLVNHGYDMRGAAADDHRNVHVESNKRSDRLRGCHGVDVSIRCVDVLVWQRCLCLYLWVRLGPRWSWVLRVRRRQAVKLLQYEVHLLAKFRKL